MARGAVVALLLTPSIPTFEGIPSIRTEDVLLFGSAAVALAHLSLGGSVRVAWGLRQTLLVGFAVFVPLSILAGVLQHFPGTPGDLNQGIRLSKYVLIYTAVATYVRVGGAPAEKREEVLCLVVFCSVVLAAVSVQQFFDLFGLNSMYVEFVAPTQSETLLAEGAIPRPVGLAGNPNELGFLFALSALLSIYLLLTRDQKGYWVTLAIQLMALLLTLSRSAVFGLVGGTMALLVLSGALKRWLEVTGFGRTVGALALGAAVVLAVAWQTGYLSQATVRLSGFLNPFETAAYRIRIDHWQENISLFLESPLFGVGPLRQTDFIRHAADNEYLLFLRTYGLTGTLYLGAVFLLPQLPALRRRSNAGPGMDRATLLADCVLVACLLYMIPAAVYHSLVLMPVVLVLLAIGDWTLGPYAMSVVGSVERKEAENAR